MRARILCVGPVVLAVVVLAIGEVGAAVDPPVWFVDNSAASSGDGSVASPLASLAEAERHSGPGDWIFIRTGDGTTRGLDTGIHLKPNQTLLGEGVGLELDGMTVAPGAAPTLTNPNGPGVVLASGCEVAGIDIVSTRAAGIVGREVIGCRLRDLRIASVGGSGVELRDAGGRITLERVLIDGAAGDGLDLAGNSSVPAARLEFKECQLNDIGEHGIDARLAGSTDIHLTIDGCGFAGITGTAASVAVEDHAAVRFRMERSRVVGAGMGVDLTVLDSGNLDFHIIDNMEFSEIGNTIVNLFVDPDSTPEARVSGRIERNPKMSKKPGSGFGIRLSCNGSGTATAVVRDNRIVGGVDADYGLLAEARLGSAVLDLELTGNEVTVGAEALEAVVIRSRDQASVCASVADNRATGGRNSLLVQQRGDSVFALAGIAADGIDPVAAKHRLALANPGLRDVVATADGEFSGAAEGCGIEKE